MNDKNQKARKNKRIESKNILETTADLTTSVARDTFNGANQLGEDFFKQLLGIQELQRSELQKKQSVLPGEKVSLNSQAKEASQAETMRGNKDESRLILEENQTKTAKLNELESRLKIIINEAKRLADSTSNLGNEVKSAVLNPNINPSEYEIGFFEGIIANIVNFRKKIDIATEWMVGMNKRAEKKNYWSQYKKKGASFLLSPDHYSQRSAG